MIMNHIQNQLNLFIRGILLFYFMPLNYLEITFAVNRIINHIKNK